jgi:hypothetical protein
MGNRERIIYFVTSLPYIGEGSKINNGVINRLSKYGTILEDMEVFDHLSSLSRPGICDVNQRNTDWIEEDSDVVVGIVGDCGPAEGLVQRAIAVDKWHPSSGTGRPILCLSSPGSNTLLRGCRTLDFAEYTDLATAKRAINSFLRKYDIKPIGSSDGPSKDLEIH